MKFRLSKIFFYVSVCILFVSCGEPNPEVCGYCKGQGRVNKYCLHCLSTGKCHACHGTGDCPFCSLGYVYWGGKQELCSSCQGHYRFACHDCHGSGICQICHAIVEVCPYCKGTGKNEFDTM